MKMLIHPTGLLALLWALVAGLATGLSTTQRSELILDKKRKEVRGASWTRYVPCKSGDTPQELVDGVHPDLAVVMCPGGQLTALNATTGAVVWGFAGPQVDSDGDQGEKERKKAFEELLEVEKSQKKLKHPPQDHCQWIVRHHRNNYAIVCWTLKMPTYKGVLYAMDAYTGNPLWTSESYTEPCYWKSLDVLSYDPDHAVESGLTASGQKHPPTRGVQIAALAFFRTGRLITFDVTTGKELCVIKGRASTVYDPPVEYLRNSGGRFGKVFISNTTSPLLLHKQVRHRRPYRVMDIGADCKPLDQQD